MAKVEFMNAILSGKMGGSVYARNRGGAYVRAYVRNINPNTDAQNGARDSFGTASASYHSLDPGNKSAWSEFANIYTSRKGTPGGNLSGFNAYVALLNTVNNMNRLSAQIVNVKSTSGGSNIPGVKENWVFNPIAPPNATLLPNIKDDTLTDPEMPLLVKPSGSELAATLLTINADDVNVRLAIKLQGGLTSGYELSNSIRDSNARRYGFGIYMSKGKTQKGMFMPNPTEILLAVAKPQTITTPVTGVSHLWLEGTVTIDKSKYQEFPNPGETVRLSVYQIGKEGQFNKIYSTDHTTN